MSAEKIVRREELIAKLRTNLFHSHIGMGDELIGKVVDCLLADSILITREQLEAAINAIHQTGHQPNCRFQGCTCGQVEDFIVARGTFIKLWQPFLRGQL